MLQTHVMILPSRRGCPFEGKIFKAKKEKIKGLQHSGPCSPESHLT